MLRFIVFLLAASTVGCSLGHGCSEVGCRSGLELDVALTKSLPPLILIEACVDSTCHSVTVPSARANDTSALPYDGHSLTVTSTLVTIGTATTPDHLSTFFGIADGDRLLNGTSFSVMLRDGATGALIAGTTTGGVTWQLDQPNGESCDPTCEVPANVPLQHVTP